MKTFSRVPNERTFSRIACPVCGNTVFSVKWDLETYSFSKCGRCGLVLQNPQPKSGELVQRYDQKYFEYEIENEEAFFQLMLLGLRDVDFFTEIEPALDPLGKGGRFLDIGCATGKLLDYVKKRGWSEKGIEVCIPAAEYARDVRGLDVTGSTLQEARLKNASFDIVHASHLIEHLTDPGDFVRQAYDLLKPGGTVILTTPNSSGFQALLYGDRWRSAIADHMFLFSKHTLPALLEKAGFTVEKTRTWGGIAAGLAPRPVKKFLDTWVKKIGWGDVMIIRARKPV